ncbi:MAG: radical SAM protein [Elusimicrobia bacterium]|nr:radical SAM protein [Elusimicrobiota bacterium]MBU2614595.1 radical SAM protein [Elusimicrobiota bacterium]
MFLDDILDYQGTVIRPPSEADSLILQITLGCTDNSCIFCPAYKDKKFKIKDFALIEKDIRRASKVMPETRRIFLADGDAIAIEMEVLVKILDLLNEHFPKLSRVAIYGSIKSLENKSVADLVELKNKKLGIVYLGFETGDEEVYRMIKKYGSPIGNVDTCMKVKEAGIKTNVTVILGLGGKKYTKQHATNTAKILNQAQPDQIAALTLMITPGTLLHSMLKRKEFEELDNFEFLEELKTLIENLEDFKGLFFSNHASNYYPISARFPRDKKYILETLDKVIKKRDNKALKPEFSRGL